MVRRIIGLIFLIVGAAGLAVSYFGHNLTQEQIDVFESGIDEVLLLTTETLDNVIETLVLAQVMVRDVNTAVETTTTTASNLSTAIDDTQPLLDELSQVATEDVPESLEAVQDALPALEQAASTIDTTLRTLSRFEIDQSILGFQLQYDLGIDYNPDVPFDVAIQEISISLEGVPDTLRQLDEQLATTSENINTISRDVDQLASDISVINERLLETEPLIEEYIRIFTDVGDRVRLVRSQLGERAEAARQVATIAFIWIAFLQLPALYLGIELISGQQDPGRYVSKKEFEALVARLTANESTAAEVEQDDDQVQPDQGEVEAEEGEEVSDEEEEDVTDVGQTPEEQA